jgi:hypothetical protein
MASRVQSLTLYRNLLRSAQRFSNYNFREYAFRLTRDDFRSSQQATGADAERAYQRGTEQLESLKRMVVVSEMYPQGKHAMD